MALGEEAAFLGKGGLLLRADDDEALNVLGPPVSFRIVRYVEDVRE